MAKVLAGKSIKSVAFSVAIDDGMLNSVLTNTKQRGKNHPTRVGTSEKSVLRNYMEGDHPHACGDKPLFIASLIAVLGSSPRVWGQGVVVAAQMAVIRIIPTRVGTSVQTSIQVLTI